jgi:hypothetical protein
MWWYDSPFLSSEGGRSAGPAMPIQLSAELCHATNAAAAFASLEEIDRL